VTVMAKHSNARIPLTFRFSPWAAHRIKQFLADYAGKPLYLKSGAFAEAALIREIERLELALSTGAPLDRLTGDGEDEASLQPAPINAHPE